MMPMLRVEQVAWRAGGARILDGVSLDVSTGELVALMGRNGAGKSTLLDVVAGLRRPTAGSVRLDGRSLRDWKANELARVMGHLPQTVRADLPFSVEQLVLMGRYPHADGWFESDDDRAAVERAMSRASCLDLRGRRVSTLSGGERQRVLLAACLAQEPRLFLLDEPATFLDIDQQVQCFTLLRQEADAGTACIAVTHDLNLALTFCTRIVVLSGGTIAVDLSAAEAARSTEWLGLFSSRLRVATTPEGQPWVWYA